MIYAELDIRNYYFRTISNTKREALETLEQFWLSKKDPWKLTLDWQQVVEDGYITIYELELNKVSGDW